MSQVTTSHERTWSLAAVPRFHGGEVEVAQVMGMAVDHVALERPLDVGGVRVVGHDDHVFAVAVPSLKADLFGCGETVGGGEAVNGRYPRPARTRAMFAIAVGSEVDSVDVAGVGIGAVVVEVKRVT